MKHVFTTKQAKEKDKEHQIYPRTAHVFPLLSTYFHNRHDAIIHSRKKETRRCEEKEAERSMGTTPQIPHILHTTRWGSVSPNMWGVGRGKWKMGGGC